ncbi:hypothetical protein TWF506_009948 [Arthrobotrys conoides]|uniref:F-box domain-containing protein n=1 Tax=Arthrobotrys conoides TaxID=74498 RepID=A0AAN8RLP5_9PEZI
MSTNVANSLNVLPPEIHLQILESLPRDDQEALSLCSKYYRKICLPFLFERIVLDGGDASVFLEGGPFEHICRHIKYVRLHWRNLDHGREVKDVDRVKLYIDLHTKMTALKLFSSLKTLRVFLKVVESTEIEAYMVLLRVIANSEFRNTLEELEIQIEKNNYFLSWSSGWIHTGLISALSTEELSILGETVPEDLTPESFTSMTPNLPALKRLTLSIHELPLPIDDLTSDEKKGFGFYYHLLTSAPQLHELHVNTIIETNPHPFYDTGRELHPDILRAFSQIKTLSLRIYNGLQDESAQRLTEIFPNLEHLDIQPHPTFGPSTWNSIGCYFNEICNLERLRTLILPWPIIAEIGSLPTNVLELLGCQWRSEGAVCLENVVFVGKLRSNGRYEDVEARLEYFTLDEDFKESWGEEWEEGEETWGIELHADVDDIDVSVLGDPDDLY